MFLNPLPVSGFDDVEITGPDDDVTGPDDDVTGPDDVTAGAEVDSGNDVLTPDESVQNSCGAVVQTGPPRILTDLIGGSATTVAKEA
jgi:hypothetical protein